MTTHQKGPLASEPQSSSPSPSYCPTSTTELFQTSILNKISSLSSLIKFDQGIPAFLEKTAEITEQVSSLSDQVNSALFDQLDADELLRIYQHLRDLTKALGALSFFTPERSASPAGRQLCALLASSGSQMAEVAPELVQRFSAVLALTASPDLMPSLPLLLPPTSQAPAVPADLPGDGSGRSAENPPPVDRAQ